MKRFVAPILLAGTVVGCAPDKPEVVVRTQAGGTQQTAFVVDDETFTVEDVQERLDVLPEWARARFVTVDRKKNFLASMTQFELLVDEAERRGYDDDPETLDRYEEAIAEAWLDEQVAAESPDEAELRAYFDENIGEFRRGEARVTYILQTLSKERADELRSRVLEAPEGERLARFRELAQTFSLDRPSGRASGLVGAFTESNEQIKAGEPEFFRPPDDWTGDFADVPWTLSEGEVSEPIEREGRWLLVMWEGSVPPEEVDYEDVASDVRAAWEEERREQIRAQFAE